MVKRYDAWLAYEAYGAYVSIEEADDGCFVSHEDYAALQAENERLKASHDGLLIPADQWPDELNGDNAKLVSCINALLSMDAAGALVPHGIGGHARSLLAAAAHRVTKPATTIDLGQFRAAVMWWRPEGIPRQFRRKGDRTGDRLRAHIAEADRLLALIDAHKGE